MNRRLAVVGLLVAAIVGAIWWRSGRDHAADPRTPASVASGRASPASSNGAPAAPPPTDHVAAPIHIRRLAPADRADLAAKIAAAQAERRDRRDRNAATATGPAIPDQVHVLDLEHAPVDLKDALEEAIPILESCYGDAPADAGALHKAIVMMTLRGDPDLGTLVDPDQLTAEDGSALEPALATCLRTTLESLELPPLQQGDELSVQYSFVFGH